MSIKGIPEPSLIDEDRKRVGAVNWPLSAAADGGISKPDRNKCKANRANTPDDRAAGFDKFPGVGRKRYDFR
jgi:hypothetical protein